MSKSSCGLIVGAQAKYDIGHGFESRSMIMSKRAFSHNRSCATIKSQPEVLTEMDTSNRHTFNISAH